MNPANPEFQRTFVAVAYCVGARGEALLAPLAEPSPRARELVAQLAAEDRPQRARALATELEMVARRLAKLGLPA
jgi:hypothetical protein